MSNEFDFTVLFRSPFAWLMVATVAGVVAGIVGTIATNWRKVRIAEQEAALKQSMIDRGMSADEIVRVLAVGNQAKHDD